VTDAASLGTGPSTGRFRLLVCGGPQFTDRARVFRALDAAHAKKPIDRLLEGSGAAAVTLAGEWAAQHRCIRESCSPIWPGSKSVRRTLDQASASAVLAFPGDDGSGWVELALAAGLKVWRPYG
jgi:hypothetical protein